MASSPAPDARDAFAHLPWARALMDAPGAVHEVPFSRHPKASGEDSLLAETLNTERGIRAALVIYRLAEPPSAAAAAAAPETSSPTTLAALPVHQTTVLTALGDGVNGHPGVLHGGMVATLIDEGMGMLQSVNHERAHAARVARGLAPPGPPTRGYGAYTADLRVGYKRMIRTPGVVSVVAWYERREGRKEWIRAELRQRKGERGEEGEEEVCATGEALFIVKPDRATDRSTEKL